MRRKWVGRAHSYEVFSEFVSLFPRSVYSFAKELLNVFVTPILCFTELQTDAEKILKFLQNVTCRKETVGCVCSLSDFRFEMHGNPKFGSKQKASGYLRATNGKLEKSFLSLSVRYPGM